MRRTREEAQKTRTDLLDAAECLFWERGVGRTTLEDIAHSAGTTRGAVYHHFQNKQDLLQQILDRGLSRHEDDLARIEVDEALDPIAGLRASFIAALESFAHDPSQRRVAGILLQRCEPIAEMAEVLEDHRRKIVRSRETLVRLLERAQARGLLAPIWPPQLAATALQAVTVGLIHGWIRSPDDAELRRDGVACLDAFFTAIRR